MAARTEDYALTGNWETAALLGVSNDVTLLAEEYDPHAGRMLGNFPQAISHVGLVNTALNHTRQAGPAENRSAAELPAAADAT